MEGQYTPPKDYDTPLPDLLALIAQQNPKRPLAQLIREHPGGPTDAIYFTWEEVIQHAHNAAANLRNAPSDSAHHFKAIPEQPRPRKAGSPPVVVGLLANNGYTLYINIIACLINRWTALLISPKNSQAAVEHLLRISKSTLLIVEPTNIALARQMEQAIPGLCAQPLAALDTPGAGLNPSTLTEPTREQFEKEMALPAFFLHTSGSTGHPKLVPWSHEFVLSGARGRLRDHRAWIGLPLYSVPPIIHAAGMVLHFMYTIAHGHILNFVSSATPRPPSAISILDHLPFFKDGILIVTPSVLEDVHALGSKAVESIARNTRLVSYAGAPLNRAIGDSLVAAGVRLEARYGSTEIGFASTHLSKRLAEDWEYVEFREGYTWNFVPVEGVSDLRELIVGPGTDGCPAVVNHSEPFGYATNDIWEPHPTSPNFWRHHSRKGDVTVLSNGEKSDNKQIENLLLSDKRIRHVQVFGAGRPLNGVLLQPIDFSVPVAQFRAQIEPTIDYANSILPNHSMLVPELIIVANAERSFSTTDKGTVKRKETLDMYEKEIQGAYEHLEEGGSEDSGKFEGSIGEESDLRAFIRDIVRMVLGKPVPDDGDLFEHGFDSLLAIRLRSALLSAVKKTPMPQHAVSRNVVYTFPSINALTDYLLSCVRTTTPDVQYTIEDRIRTSIAKFSASFVQHTPGSRVVHGKVIALSGSTGSVGCSMLSLLLERGDVKKIYLLNRSGKESQEKRQAKGFAEKALDPAILDAKKSILVYLDVDFSRKDLGLTKKDYQDLRDNATHIIHVAWQLNFNFVLESYERVHIAGVRHLIDLALSSPQARPPRLTFLSTIGAALMYKGPSEEPSVGDRAGQCLVPEAPVDDPRMALDQGYGQSKYVSERVIVNAAGAGLPATVVRVGQLSGTTTNGAWARDEYVPIMLRSSLALGVVPSDLPPFRWIPSDIAASALIKQSFDDTSGLQYFSVDNPFPTQWSVVLEALSVLSPKPLRLVTFAEWLDHIRKINPDPREVPATKLFDFFTSRLRGKPVSTALGWNKSVKIAPELAMGPIPAELVQKYILYQQQAGKPWH